MKSNYKHILLLISVVMLTLLIEGMNASSVKASTLFKYNWALDSSGKVGSGEIYGDHSVKVPIKNMRSGGLQRFFISIYNSDSPKNGYFKPDNDSASFLTEPYFDDEPLFKLNLNNLSAFESQKDRPYQFTIDYNNRDGANPEKITFQLYDLAMTYSVDGGKSFSEISDNTKTNPIKLNVNDYPDGFDLRVNDDYPAGSFAAGSDYNSSANINVSTDGKVKPTDPQKGIKNGTIIHVTYTEGKLPNQAGSVKIHNYYFKYVDQDMTASDASIYTGTAVTPDTFKANAGDQKITIWDGNKDITGTSYSEQGAHYVTLKAHGYNDKTVRLVVSQAPATPTQATGTVTQPQKPSSSQTSTTPGTTAVPTTGENAPVIGQVVYSVGPIYMYKKPTFSNSSRVSYYKQYKRINRPMFKVIDYAKSANGALRYKVKDVNHRGDNAGNVGYITANSDFVVPAYYASVSKTKRVRVIASKGVNSYSYKSLSGKVKHYKNGTTLKVKKVVKHNLTTRYQLTNGKYITANKKMVIKK